MFEHICTTVVDDVSKLNYNVSFLLPHNEFCFNVIGLTIFMSNVHNRFMDDYGTSRGNGLVYGFLEPQCIHNAKDRRQQCQHYIETWVKESQRQLYLGAYLNQ